MLTDEQIGEIATSTQDGISPRDDTLCFARAIESAACAERDKRITEIEENERAFKQVILQIQDSIDFLQKKVDSSNARNRPLSNYEFDEIG